MRIPKTSDLPGELRRLEATNFFQDKPADQSKSDYLEHIAGKEAARFGVYDYLANFYALLAGYAKTVGV